MDKFAAKGSAKNHDKQKLALTRLNVHDILALWQAYSTCPFGPHQSSCSVSPCLIVVKRYAWLEAMATRDGDIGVDIAIMLNAPFRNLGVT
jgi:hypothetical protein